MRVDVAVLALCLSLSAATSALAQQPRPVPPVVFDLRAFYSGLGQDPTTAEDLSLTPDDLPQRGLGGVAALHVYPLRRQGFALGLGAEVLLARGRAQQTDATGDPIGLAVTQRLRSIGGALSLNFGHRNGWSYLTAGFGRVAFYTYLGDERPTEPPPDQNTINMGGGARWFTTNHLAFTFDVRFHLTRPELETPSYPTRQRTRLLILSAGIAIK